MYSIGLRLVFIFAFLFAAACSSPFAVEEAIDPLPDAAPDGGTSSDSSDGPDDPDASDGSDDDPADASDDSHSDLPDAATTNQLAFKTQPSDATAGHHLSPTVRVEVVDQDRNLVSDVAADITIALVGGPADAKLIGPLTARAENGVATFEGLKIERAGSGYSLVASAENIAQATSTTFSIEADNANRLAFISMPTEAEGQVPLSPPVEVEAQDRYENRADWTGKITVSLSGGVVDATLSGMTTVIANGGLAVFDDLAVAQAGKGYTLFAEASGLLAAESSPFDVRLSFKTVRAALLYTCGLTEAGKAYCWGSNTRGELGVDSAAETPTAVATAETFTDLSAQGYFVCGLSTGKRIFCWGGNDYGQLGDTTTEHRSTPAPIIGFPDFTAVSAGNRHACGLNEAGKALCWGSSEYGQLGTGTSGSAAMSRMPVEVSTAEIFTAISAGGSHTCGLTTEGKAYCWGRNTDGQLGNGNNNSETLPSAVDSEVEFASLSVGDRHTCGLTKAGKAYCWGRGNSGRLGDGTSGSQSTPTAVSTDKAFTMLSAASSHSCGLTEDGKAYCWGSSDRGQLGDGTDIDRLTPTAVSGDLTFATLSAGSSHTCGVAVSGETYCWGFNAAGQLGDGSADTQSLVPVQVVGTER